MEEIPRYIPPDWNLKSWARIAYAASLWDKPSIRSLIEPTSRSLAEEIKELVGKKEKEIHSPKAILDEVLWTFKSMGQRIDAWFEYAQNILKIPKDIAEKVHWTTYGTIDERKMFQDLISSKTFHQNLVPIETIYSLACSNVLIEYINVHWEKMLTFYEANETPSILLYCTDPRKARELIIASVIFFANRNDSRIPLSYVEKYSDVKNMLELSITGGYPTAARYYWCQLNENQKNELIFTTAKTVNLQYFPLKDCRELYKSQCLADLLIFFLNSTSDDDLRMWEDEKFRCGDTTPYILDLFVRHWPWKEFLPLAYNLTSKYCTNKEKCTDLLFSILRGMNRNNAFGFWNKQNFAGKLFKFAWDKMKPYGVQKYLNSNKRLAEEIFQVFDLQILNLVINTGYDEGQPRYILLNDFQYSFGKIIKANQWERLEKFASDVLQCENDRVWFRDLFCKYLLSIYGRMPA